MRPSDGAGRERERGTDREREIVEIQGQSSNPLE